MNIQDLGSLGELIAAIATVATLLYLAIQIRFNTSVALSDAETELQTRWNAMLSEWSGSTTSANVIRRGMADFELLSRDEQLVFNGYLSNLVNLHRIAARMHEKNLVKDDLLDSASFVVVSVLKTPGGAAWWGQMREWFLGNDYVDHLLETKQDIPSLIEVPLWQYDLNEGK